jgi:undecaprenyl-diphosphatase
MFVFSAIPLLSKEFPKIKKLWLILAVLVGFSRVYLGLHFLSDVIAGGIVGYFIGLWVIRLERDKKYGERVWNRLFR